jgi:hypothetical protein
LNPSLLILTIIHIILIVTFDLSQHLDGERRGRNWPARFSWQVCGQRNAPIGIEVGLATYLLPRTDAPVLPAAHERPSDVGVSKLPSLVDGSSRGKFNDGNLRFGGGAFCLRRARRRLSSKKCTLPLASHAARTSVRAEKASATMPSATYRTAPVDRTLHTCHHASC